MTDPFEVTKSEGDPIPTDTATFVLRRKYLLDQLKIVSRELHKLYRGHAMFLCPYPKGTKCQYLSALGPVPGEVLEYVYLYKHPFYQLKIKVLSEGTYREIWVDDFKRLIFAGAKHGR